MSPSSLEQIGSLPALPYVAHEILIAVNDGEADLRRISETLSKEPGLTARIIAMANSAFFAGSRPVYSVEDAVVRLGLNRVRVLAASILLAAHFDSGRCRSFRTERYWYDAMGTAFAATRLARHLTLGVPDDAAYLAGLLHNIGLLLLAYVFPVEMGAILAEKELDPELSVGVLARQRLGCDQHEAGQLLLTEWELPPEIALVAGHCHEERYHGEHEPLVHTIRFCAQWAADGFTAVPDASRLPHIDGKTLNAIGNACRKENEQLEALARLLAAA